MKRHLSLAILLLLPAMGAAQEFNGPPDPKEAAWKAFAKENGTDWVAVWNKATNTPKAIYGPGLKVQNEKIESLAKARTHADRILTRYATLLGRGGSTFVETIGVKAASVYIFVYDQTFKGLRVISGRADVRVHDTGAISMFGSKAVAIPATFNTTSAITASQAGQAGHSSLGLLSSKPGTAGPELVILADAEGKTLTTPQLVWEVPVNGALGDLLRIGKVYIDAWTGRMVKFVNEIYNGQAPAAAVSGNVKCWTNTGLTPIAPLVNIPLENLLISISGVGTTYTDALGNFSMPYAGTAPVNLTVSMTGKHIKTITPLQGVALTKQVQITPGTPLNIQLSTATATEFDFSQSTTYWATNKVNEWVRGIITTGGTSQLNHISGMTSTVNRAKTCNAYYTRNTINFYAKGGTCNMTGFSTVIYHEWGHGVDDAFGGISQTDGLSEGWGDTIATYLSDQAIVGSFFRTNGGYIRTALNTRAYPSGSSVHQKGESWMGFAWDVRLALSNSMGKALGIKQAEKIFIGSIPADATNQPDAIREVFLLDDDDANLLNGTPHYKELEAGAKKRNIPYPVRKLAVITHTPLTSTINQLTPRLVKANVVATMGNVTKVEVVYNPGTGAIRRELIPTGIKNEYIGLLPGQLSPSSMAYHFEATHSANAVIRHPEAGEISYSLGKEEVFFTDDFEGANKGWTHAQVATQDDWQLGSPAGKSGTSQSVSWADPKTAYSGTKIWANDLGNVIGTSNWNGAYKPNVENWLHSPALNLSGKTGVTLRFRRWLTVEESSCDKATINVNNTNVWTNPPVTHTLDKAWSLVEYRLPMADNNPSVTIEWRLKSDPGMELGGWNIDDVKVFSFSKLPPPAVQFQMTPAQVDLGGKAKINIQGKANATCFLLLSSTAGPLQFPGFPLLSVGPQMFLVQVNLDSTGAAQMSLPIPNEASLTGAMLYAQVLEATDPLKAVFTASNPMVILFGK